MLNTTSPFNGFEFLSKSRTNITSGVYSVLAITAALNIFTCPFAILLNTLVIVAVKTKRHLRTKSNISLACLATTDFAVGLIAQPLAITFFILFLIESPCICDPSPCRKPTNVPLYNPCIQSCPTSHLYMVKFCRSKKSPLESRISWLNFGWVKIA